jgi:hypothetical protein
VNYLFLLNWYSSEATHPIIKLKKEKKTPLTFNSTNIFVFLVKKVKDSLCLRFCLSPKNVNFHLKITLTLPEGSFSLEETPEKIGSNRRRDFLRSCGTQTVSFCAARKKI